jgi:pimeloyl-ACP methyl ester carboxylesterase
MSELDLTAISRRSEADERLAVAIPNPAERSFLLQNLVFGDGKPRWRPNLAAIETALTPLAGFPTFAVAAAYRKPALFIAGEQSDYVRSEHEAAIRRLFPLARIARVAGAGHWVHAEQPESFLGLIEPFLAG